MIGWIWAVMLYLQSDALLWIYLGLPDPVRWAGLIASVAAVGFLVWVFKVVGTAGAETIVTFDDMKLATTGPYSRIRHPMYVGLFTWSLTWCLSTDNWLVSAPLASFIVFIALVRVPHEERVLLAHFGDDYRRYVERTHRFLPW